tara:strand:- start:215 stop:511 length:297 start_codon:yes stop_codon:yes gene_type:complete
VIALDKVIDEFDRAPMMQRRSQDGTALQGRSCGICGDKAEKAKDRAEYQRSAKPQAKHIKVLCKKWIKQASTARISATRGNYNCLVGSSNNGMSQLVA